MPPFAGNADDVEALVQLLRWETDGRAGGVAGDRRPRARADRALARRGGTRDGSDVAVRSRRSLWLALYVATLALHAVFVALRRRRHARSCSFRQRATRSPATVRDRLPFMLGCGITAGVAPLLFLQLLHQRRFYTANLLLGPRWCAVVPALIVGFYALYLAKASSKWRARSRSASALACFAFVAWSWSELHELMQADPAWARVLRRRPSRVHAPRRSRRGSSPCSARWRRCSRRSRRGRPTRPGRRAPRRDRAWQGGACRSPVRCGCGVPDSASKGLRVAWFAILVGATAIDVGAWVALAAPAERSRARGRDRRRARRCWSRPSSCARRRAWPDRAPRRQLGRGDRIRGRAHRRDRRRSRGSCARSGRDSVTACRSTSSTRSRFSKPQATVFAVLDDVSRTPEWLSRCTKIEKLDPGAERGRDASCATTICRARSPGR